jgi:trimeric autotransporter adhesin
MSIQLTGSLDIQGSITGSLLGTASFATSASQAVSASFATTASFALNAGTTVSTASLLTTASATNNVITFTKGDASTFNVTVATGSGGSAFPFTGSAQITGSLGITGSISNVRSGSVETINNVIFGNGIRTGANSTGSIGIGTAFPSATTVGSATAIGNVFIVTNPNFLGGPTETALTNGNFNVVVGAATGTGITSGTGNTLIGTLGPPITTNSNVTSVGYYNQPAKIGSGNTLLGSEIGGTAGYFGNDNIFIGSGTANEAGTLSPTNNISSSVGIGNNALRYTTGNSNLALGHNAGNYVTGSNEFFVDMFDRGSYSGNKTGSLMYGQFNTTSSTQMLTINSLLRLQPIATLPAAGTIGRLAVSGSSGNAKIYFDNGSSWNALF